MSENLPITERTRVRRIPRRGNYERETIYRILDEGLICHVGFADDGGKPFVIPTAYARRADEMIIHGSAASRMMRALAAEREICVTVTLLDGLVLARSAFHHSMNYRSVVVFGKAEIITDEAEKTEALRLFTEHLIPQRWDEIRLPTAQELKATTVLSLPLNEASAKIRTGAPVDDEADYELDVWAGVIPLELAAGAPVSDERSKGDIHPPDYALDYTRRASGEF